MIVVGDTDTVFGPLDGSVENLPEGFRAHGSTHEAQVPLVVYNADVDFSKWDQYISNCHLTSHIQFEA